MSEEKVHPTTPGAGERDPAARTPPARQVAPEPVPVGRSVPRWWTRLRRDWKFWATGTALLGLVALVLAGPLLSPYGESEMNLANTYRAPGGGHWFGTDSLGRDLLTRVLYGGRISLAVGAMGALISLALGVTIGGLAGLAGGWIEKLVLRLIDIMYGVPLLLVVIALMVLTGSGLRNVFIALGLVYWLEMARVVRARVAELRGREFVTAARALGAGTPRVFLRHILPNTTGVVVVTATFMVPLAIFTESFLSFLGLGVTLPHASWGTLAADGLEAMRTYPHVLIFPAVAICVTMFLFQTLGEALRGALDPRQAEQD